MKPYEWQKHQCTGNSKVSTWKYKFFKREWGNNGELILSLTHQSYLAGALLPLVLSKLIFLKRRTVSIRQRTTNIRPNTYKNYHKISSPNQSRAFTVVTHQGSSKYIFLTWFWPWKRVWFETADKPNTTHIYIPSAFQRAVYSLLCLMFVSGLGDSVLLSLKAKLMLHYARQCFYPKWKPFCPFKSCLMDGTGPEKSQGEKSVFVETSPARKCSSLKGKHIPNWIKCTELFTK